MAWVTRLWQRVASYWSYRLYRRSVAPGRSRPEWDLLTDATLDRVWQDEADDRVLIVGDSTIPHFEALAVSLVDALASSDGDLACGPVFDRHRSPRASLNVGAAGFEVGHDGSDAFLIPLLAGEAVRREWARAITTAPRPSGSVFALRRATVRSAFSKESFTSIDELIAGVSARGPWLVVWAAAQLGGGAPQASVTSMASVEKRRYEGRGETVEVEAPSAASPGTPAPPPSAIWVGAGPTRLHAGFDTTGYVPRVAIRHAATDWSVATRWGDHHFAAGLARGFEELHVGSRVVPRHAWEHPFAARDVIVTLRGLAPVVPVKGRINILWVISHPEEIDTRELEAHDLVAVASSADVERVAGLTGTPVVPLLQATDRRFERHPGDGDGSCLFVGNSRGVARRAVMWARELGFDPEVYGMGWEEFGVPSKGPLDNTLIADRFNTASVVLGDHWDDMRDLGYVSNRVFDVAAAGGLIVVDRVNGIEGLVPGVQTFDSPAELGRLIGRWLDPANSAERMEAIERQQAAVLERHTFGRRAREILEAVSALVPGGRELVASITDS